MFIDVDVDDDNNTSDDDNGIDEDTSDGHDDNDAEIARRHAGPFMECLVNSWL